MLNSLIRKLWLTHAPQYYWGDNFDVRFKLCQMLASCKNTDVLDLGSNIGVISGTMDPTCKVRAIDSSTSIVEIGSQLFSHVQFEAENIIEVKSKTQFDVIILAHVIECFQSDLSHLFKHADSLLKKGGTLFITTPNGKNSYYNGKPLFNKATLEPYLKKTGWKYNWLYWNPISIKLSHLYFVPGLFQLIDWTSFNFPSEERCVSFLIQAKKI